MTKGTSRVIQGQTNRLRNVTKRPEEADQSDTEMKTEAVCIKSGSTGERERERDRQTDRQTHRHTDRHTDTQTHRQRQTDSDRETERDREKERNSRTDT